MYYSNTQNINTGKEWSQIDLDDIHGFAAVMTLSGLADYLCRSEDEVAVKLEECLGVETCPRSSCGGTFFASSYRKRSWLLFVTPTSPFWGRGAVVPAARREI
jgi:hypothetical protein